MEERKQSEKCRTRKSIEPFSTLYSVQEHVENTAGSRKTTQEQWKKKINKVIKHLKN